MEDNACDGFDRPSASNRSCIINGERQDDEDSMEVKPLECFISAISIYLYFVD